MSLDRESRIQIEENMQVFTNLQYEKIFEQKFNDCWEEEVKIDNIHFQREIVYDSTGK